MFTKSTLTHRHNADGRFDSICLYCFRTVASDNTEARLAEKERRHRCMAEDLETVRGHPRRWHGLKSGGPKG